MPCGDPDSVKLYLVFFVVSPSSLRYDYHWSETQLSTDKSKRTESPRKLNDVEFYLKIKDEKALNCYTCVIYRHYNILHGAIELDKSQKSKS